jgi:hypothetical protein
MFAVLLLVLLVSACNMPVGEGAGTPTQGLGGVQTAAAQTVQALLQTQAALDPTAQQPTTDEVATQALPTAVVSTLAPLPSLTPQGSVKTVVPTAAATPCNRASFVDDITIPDGTNIASGANFTKTWRLKNTGSCSWTTAYKLVFSSGDAMGGPASAALPNNVDPNQTVDLSVTLKAPTTAKTYQGNWKLQDASGVNFGLGTKGDQPFWVKIVVGSGTPGVSYFAVTGIQISADPATYNGDCPFTLKLSAKITVSKAGTVSYFWERNDGGTTTKRNVEFDKASTKTVTETIDGYGFAGYSLDGSYRLYVDNPNHQYFGPVKVKITCNP